MPTLYDQSLHANSNMVCAIDIHTTGFKPYFHEICEIVVMPLDSTFKPNKKIMPFHMEISPSKPERIDLETATVTKGRMTHLKAYGTDSFKAGDMFLEWFEKIEFLRGKSILPLCYDWPRLRPFLYDWLGPYNADSCFNYRYRDILSTANYLNDYADINIENCPFPKVNYEYIASCCKIPRDKNDGMMMNCKTIGQIYYYMIQHSIMYKNT